jgi:hypothetical protein
MPKSRKRRTQRKRKAPRAVDGISGMGGNAMLRIPKSPKLIMPDRFYTTTRYWKFPSISLAIANFGAIRFSPSSAYDVDPTVGSTAMSGYAELAAFYGSYRVLKSTIRCEFINNSAIVPLMCIVCPLNIDPGATPTTNVIQEWKEQPYSVSRASGLVGSPNVVLTRTMTTERIFGSKMVYFDDAFQAATNNVPANNWWWAIGIFSNSVIATNPINISVTIDVSTEFFNRKFLAA